MSLINKLRDRLEVVCPNDEEVFEWLNELEVQLSVLEYDLRDAEGALCMYEDMMFGDLEEDDTDYSDFNPWDGKDIYGEGIGDGYD